MEAPQALSPPPSIIRTAVQFPVTHPEGSSVKDQQRLSHTASSIIRTALQFLVSHPEGSCVEGQQWLSHPALNYPHGGSVPVSHPEGSCVEAPQALSHPAVNYPDGGPVPRQPSEGQLRGSSAKAVAPALNYPDGGSVPRQLSGGQLRGSSGIKERPRLLWGVAVSVRGGYLLFHFRSIIGVVRFNFSVRNGKRWSPDAIATLVRLSVARFRASLYKVKRAHGSEDSGALKKLYSTSLRLRPVFAGMEAARLSSFRSIACLLLGDLRPGKGLGD